MMRFFISVFAATFTLGGALAADSVLPLGDGKIGRTPTAGYVYRCGDGGPGDRAPVSPPGPWIQAGYWSPTQKPAVSGAVKWSDARVSVEVVGDTRVISGNGLPINHATGTFPIPSSDPVYRYDRNPNAIAAQNVMARLPANPQIAAAPSCLTPGPIGYMLSGVALFDALDANGKDAPAHEIQDRCSGHPQRSGMYHYHNGSPCLSDESGDRGAHSGLTGYAADGFGIYGIMGENGAVVTNAQLDECHGHVHSIAWDGKTTTMYHYHLTSSFPYSLGCFKGTPVRLEQRSSPVPFGGPPPEGMPPRRPPPPRGDAFR